MIAMLLLTQASLAGSWEARGAVGGEINADSHGAMDLGLRKGDFSAQILTDTLDLRWQPEQAHGKEWLAARLEIDAAGLFISPWRDGGPDPEAALTASYSGVEGGAIRYLPAGFYAGAQGTAREWWFGARDATTVPVPEPRPVLSGDALVGWWKPWGSGWARAGVDQEPGLTSPHVQGQLALRPSWTVAPWLELRAGWAENQDDLMRTRLGGLNPYVVPLAGAAWAEWWVEDYAAVRAGPTLQGTPGSVAAVVDAATFDGEDAVGFALVGHGEWRKAYADLSVGDAPWIERQAGVGRVSVWFSVGLHWTALHKATAQPPG